MVRRKVTRTAQAGASVALYIRVSTAGQAEEGVSMEAQEERLRAYCAMRGLVVGHVVKDPAQSAFKPMGQRKGGRELLELVDSGAVVGVVVLKLDRAFRNAADCLATVSTWDRRGVALHIVDLGGATIDTSTAMGKMFLTISAGFAELERNLTSERTSMALAYKAARGEQIGGKAPYGYRYEAGMLAEERAEQHVMRLVRAWHGEGVSLRKIGDRLAEGGHVNRAGGRFAPEQVERILRGPKRAMPATA